MRRIRKGMVMLLRRKTILLFSLLFIIFGLGSSFGADFPRKPIEIMVGYSAGSTFDLLARVFADTASKYIGQPVVVVNKLGAGGSIAAADLFSSKADGYKIMLTTNFFFAMTTKTQKVPFNPDDLIPLVNLIELKNGLVVKSDSDLKTLDDVIAYAKKNPGQLKWAHTGSGTSQHLYGLLLFRKAGVQTIDVPYKGSADQIPAVLGGHLDASFITYGAAKEHVKAGKLKYLVTVGNKRYSDPPNVPCAAELGFDDVGKLSTLVGLYIHKNTPPDALKVIFNCIDKTIKDPNFLKGIDNLGEQPRFMGSKEMEVAIADAVKLSVPLLKEFNLIKD